MARTRLRRLPPSLILLALAAVLLAVNWAYQVLRKPSELAGLLLPVTSKSPRATWQAYGDLFEAHATAVMKPELLAALAQVESSGNPAARTYWRWRWTLDPARVFAPASSAVGMFQITDGTYYRCRNLCVHYGEVRRAGRWYDPRGCWFNVLYNRLIPSHSVELTSACLDEQARALAGPRAPLELKRDVAAVSHLCGPRSKVSESVARGKGIPPGARCGGEDPRAYLSRVRAFESQFAALRRERAW